MKRAILFSGILFLLLSNFAFVEAQLSFNHVVIDPAGSAPLNPNVKTLGDINGDGFLDAVAMSDTGEGGYWYDYANSWAKYAFVATGSFTVDMQTGDIDNDGDKDIIVPTNAVSAEVLWFENPLFPNGDPKNLSQWQSHVIGNPVTIQHDLEVGDVNNDGKLDVVTRNTDFLVSGSVTRLWLQNTSLSWIEVVVNTDAGEGIALGDIDSDGDLDIAQNGAWFEAPAVIITSPWTKYVVQSAPWSTNLAGVTISDVNQDGRKDVLLSGSESVELPLVWYEAPLNVFNGTWSEHIIDLNVDYAHTFKTGDMDNDGDLDVVVGEMYQSGAGHRRVMIFLNNGDSLNWTPFVVDTTGTHNLRVADIGNDGDLDIFGANWESTQNGAPIEMWENLLLISPNIPIPPTNLQVTGRTQTAVSLAWNDNSNNENGFKIEYSTDAVNFNLAGTVGVNVTTFIHLNLTPSVTYFYRVRAFNAFGASAWTPVISSGVSGLYSYWAFNEAAGTTAFDLSGNGFDGTLIGLNWVTNTSLCKYETCLDFNSTSAYMNLPNYFIEPSGLTIAGWINPDNFNVTDAMIFSRASGILEQDYDYALSIADIGGTTTSNLTFNAASSAQAATSSSIFTTHTASGADRLVIISVGTSGGPSAPTVNSVTYGSQTATLINTATVSSAGATYRTTMFYLLAPATGAQTVTATFSGASDESAIGIISYTGVSQTTPLGTAVTNSGTTTAPTVTVSSAPGEIVIDGFFSGRNTNTVDASQTERWSQEQISGGFASGGGSTKPGASSVTMSWTISGAQYTNAWATIAVPIKPVSIPTGGGPFVPRFRLKTTNGGTAILTASSAATLQPGVWTHLTATYDGSFMRLYKDGIEVGSFPKTGTVVNTVGLSTWVGDNPPTVNSRPFDGKIDDVVVFEKALLQPEIQEVMNGNILPIPAFCGNGLIETGEMCDDNNANNGDGCSLVCQVEAGWECTGQPSICSLLPPPPSAPENLQANATSSTQVDLNWVDTSANEQSFVIERSTSPTSGFVSVGTTAANVQNFVDTGLSAATTYYYKVGAVNSGGTNYSSVVSVTTPTPVQLTTILRPSSAGANNAWSVFDCSLSTSWQCVDEAVPDENDYVYTNVKKKKVSFEFTDTALNPGTGINSVTLHYYAKRFSSTRNKIRPLIRIGTTDYLGNTFTLNINYEYFSQVYTANPSTGQAWTVQDLDALQAGVYTDITNQGGYVAQIYAEVSYNS